MWIYHPTAAMQAKGPEHNWYNTAADEADCRKKIDALVKSGRYRKDELTYRYFQW